MRSAVRFLRGSVDASPASRPYRRYGRLYPALAPLEPDGLPPETA